MVVCHCAGDRLATYPRCTVPLNPRQLEYAPADLDAPSVDKVGTEDGCISSKAWNGAGNGPDVKNSKFKGTEPLVEFS